MLLSESEISEILKSNKPLEAELNKKDKVNSALLIKRWGFRALVEAVANTTLSTKEKIAATVRTAIALSEFDFHLVERAIDSVGVDACATFLTETEDLITKINASVEFLEANRDAVFTVDGVRRTPGGIFWRILKANSSKEDAKYIFKGNTKRQQGIRRQMVRDRWTENHLTVLGNKSKKARTTEVANQVKAIKTIASKLSMSEVSIIERLIVKKGINFAIGLVEEVNQILQGCADSAMTAIVNVTSEEGDVKRRRTPGGIFAQLVKGKSDISESDKRFIFVRATGGRAPSMSDLMSMSLALDDKVTRPVTKTPKPNEVSTEASWEFQRKVGNTWEPGFIGQENYADPLPEFTSDENESIEAICTSIARGLKLYSDGIDFVEKVNEVVGIKMAVSAYKETCVIEGNGGMMLSESNQRRRTPKGVFIAVLRRIVGNATVSQIIGTDDTDDSAFEIRVPAPQLNLAGDHLSSKSKLADHIIIELERMRIPASDFEIIRNVVSIKGELFVRSLFEKVRKRFNKGKWLDTPGQLFGKMLKIGLNNDELNRVFDHSRTKQLIQNNKRAVSRKATVILTPSEENCVSELTLGLALIGVTANEVVTVERVIQKLGKERAIAMLKRTREIEREGGQRTRDEMRRKTPSGVYLSLLATEEKVNKDDLKFIFEKPGGSSSEERKKEDTHFAPSLFTPVNPFRVIDNSGREPEFIEKIKKQIRPSLSSLEYVSVLDPRLETVIRGVVLLGPSAINLIDQCVYTFGEKRTEGWLEISHGQVADCKASVDQLPSIYNDLVKAAGGLGSIETTADIRC